MSLEIIVVVIVCSLIVITFYWYLKSVQPYVDGTVYKKEMKRLRDKGSIDKDFYRRCIRKRQNK